MYVNGFYSSWSLGYFIHISITTHHARRLRLEKLLYIELSRKVATDILNHFWIQVAVSEVKRPSRNCFGSEAVKNL
jgi:hypothetical protein